MQQRTPERQAMGESERFEQAPVCAPKSDRFTSMGRGPDFRELLAPGDRSMKEACNFEGLALFFCLRHPRRRARGNYGSWA